MPYDTVNDFAPVSLVALVANVLAVNPQVPAKDLKELVALARAKPGTLNFATPGNGTTGHLSTELLKTMAGIDLTHVPYRGSGPALQDLLAGQVQMTIDNIPSALPHIQAGSLRALAVTSGRRWFALPDVPTMAEAGVAGYEATSWFVVMAPAKTPSDIVGRLSAEIDAQLKTEDMRKRFRDVGAEPVGGTPRELAAFLAAEQAKWKGVVEAAKIKLD
jgi:tripartite-type tricarboxylate transporter receptor subunit TctC